jgi:hypothetical protein
MSLVVNKDNIFFILPESRYAVSDRIDKFMDEDFTLFVRAKIFPDLLPMEEEQFILSRNGMHSGVSMFKDSFGNSNASFTYWFQRKTETGEIIHVPKQIYYNMQEKEQSESFHDYCMICDHFEERKIDCFVDGELVGTIKFEDDEKFVYEKAFYWFGCGDMIGPEEHRAIGNVELDMSFVLNKKLSIEEVIDIKENYKEKYSHKVFGDLRKLNYDFPLRKNFAFFCDFNYYNRYKVWDISFSGNYPQFYLEHNIYF